MKKQTAPLRKIALIGNPNVGKSVIFGLLTGKYVAVSNYPGTTVEISQGNLLLEGKRILLIDTPGVNSLIPMSEDEKVTRDILLSEAPSAVVQVGDAKNLKRTLLITLQLAEMEIPMVLDLNMVDEAMDRGITIDTATLEKKLGVPVISTIAPQRKGLRQLREALLSPGRVVAGMQYPPVIEEYIGKISRLLPAAPLSRRSLSTMILSGDESLREWLKAGVSDESLREIERLRDECAVKAKDSPAYLINKTRIGTAETIAGEVISKAKPEGGRVLHTIGRLSMHPLYGIPVLLAILYGIYEFVGVFGAGTLVDFVEETIFNGYINPMLTKTVKVLIPVELLQELLVGEYGLITVALTYAIAIILPITATFFIAFALLEDSGYLPRLAIMSNRIFNIMGLNGKAVLPMILGLGCGTMAVMTSRILETKRDRIITTFLLALAIPCSAQMGVILGILGALSLKAALIWAGSILLILFLSGFLASKLVPGERTDFFLEIPPIRIPTLTNILVKTMGRIEWYLREAVPLFLLGTFILFLLHKLNLLTVLEEIASPVVVNLLNLPPQAAEAFILGFLRRDFGAAGLFKMFEDGSLSPVQAIVSLVTITLFIPCLASFFMIIKERGLRMTLWVVGIVFPGAFLFGGLLNWVLRYFRVQI
ncbi:MAG: ferrous iron transport protein B [Alphaproteobacteria bacterium]|uniref:Ferrous iron transport protein B n=1 Tax=Candidatus Nitrobium versatile TaxID=2884831 RepID=A0A953SHE4_9BACT|nr:ferrous iron transport protein B [Candidatus Nitrobium versatile]